MGAGSPLIFHSKVQTVRNTKTSYFYQRASFCSMKWFLCHWAINWWKIGEKTEFARSGRNFLPGSTESTPAVEDPPSLDWDHLGKTGEKSFQDFKPLKSVTGSKNSRKCLKVKSFNSIQNLIVTNCLCQVELHLRTKSKPAFFTGQLQFDNIIYKGN